MFVHNRLVFAVIQMDIPISSQSGSRRDEFADNDVFLQAVQVIDLSLDRRVGKHLGGLLEGSG